MTEPVPSPYTVLPTEWLRFSVELVTTAGSGLDSSIASQAMGSDLSKSTQKPIPGQQALDKESIQRIKQYILSHNKHGSIIWPKAQKVSTTEGESADGQYYLPKFDQPTGSVTSMVRGLLSSASNYLIPPEPPLTLEVLVANRVSISALLLHCKVSITNLHAAGILRDFSDLQALHFKVKDLVRRRELFDVGKLRMLFNTTFKDMRQQGCQFSLKELDECKFYPGELETLGVSLDTMIREDGVTVDQLIELNWSLEQLQQLHFDAEHLGLLKISRRLALEPYPTGFGWSREEYKDLTSV